MFDIYDFIIIGAGPTSIATLHGLSKGLRIAALTGVARNEPLIAFKPHPKIASVAKAVGEKYGLRNPYTFNPSISSQLADTACVGGLANYWGQQLLRYRENDPWPREFFETYSVYSDACSEIESLFSFDPGETQINLNNFSAEYQWTTPRLVSGLAAVPSNGLTAMRLAFERLAFERDITVFPAIAKRLSKTLNGIQVELADGSTLRTKVVLMCAGVVSSLRITMNSNPDIVGVKLKDHAPNMLYVADLGGKLNQFKAKQSNHFNALTLERVHDNYTQLFASCYRLSKARIGLILASANLPMILNNIQMPRIFDVIRPLQVWTKSTTTQYSIERQATQARWTQNNSVDEDPDYYSFKTWLADIGPIVHQSGTFPGYGFHYHAGEVYVGKASHSLSNYLGDQFDGRVAVMDASRLTAIGTRPHTLTAMATALHCARSI